MAFKSVGVASAHKVLLKISSSAASPRFRIPLGIVLLSSLLITFSFFFRHIAGVIVTHYSYNPLVYNSSDVRSAHSTQYTYRPDDVLWDETKAYARTTQGFMRGEYGGAVLDTYASYVTTPIPRSRNFVRDGLGQWLLSAMARVLGNSVPAAFCAADFVFVFALALSLMLFCWELKPSAAFAVAGASAFMFFNWQDVLGLVHFLGGGIQNSSQILRTPYPQLAWVVFIFFLYFLNRILEAPNIKNGTFLAIAVTLNFYTYFFCWPVVVMCLFSALAVLAISAWCPINFVDKIGRDCIRALWVVFSAATVGMLLSAPVWLAYVRKGPDVVDTFLRFNGQFTHRPNLPYTISLIILALGGLVAKKYKQPVHWMSFVLILAFIGVMNIQVFTGKTIQPSHWSSYFVQPFVTLIILHFMWPLAERLGNKKVNVGVASILLVGVALNCYKFWAGASAARNYQIKDPAFAELIQLLDRQELRGLGFVSNDFYLSTVLPAYVIQKPLEPSFMDSLGNTDLLRLRLAAAKAAGFENWETFAAVSGQPNFAIDSNIVPLAFRENRLILVMNKHRDIPDRAHNHSCELLSNRDFLVLKPCDH